jgi:hypothetical protein
VTESNDDILLFSSDARQRYAEDVLAVVAAPRGDVIQFRYHSNYVTSRLQQIVRSQEVVGRSALVAFNSKLARPAGDADFVVPLRYVRVISVQVFAEIYVMLLQVEGYPELRDYPSSADEIVDHSAKYLAKLRQSNGGVFLPASVRPPAIDGVARTDDESEAWLSVVVRLVLHPTFASTHLVRIEPPRALQSDRDPHFNDVGDIVLHGDHPLRFPVHYYAEELPQGQRVISCFTDDRFLRVSSDSKYPVSSRYDSVEFWLQPGAVDFTTLSRVSMQLADPDDPLVLATRISFSVVVNRARARLLARTGLGAVGAFLLGLPAILPKETETTLKATLAVVGASLLSYVSVFLSGKRV